MKNIVISGQALLILILAAMLLFMRECKKPEGSRAPAKQIITVDTVYLPGDPVLKEVVVERQSKGSAPAVLTINNSPLPRQDSLIAQERAFQKVFYSDTLYKKDTFRAVINDSIYLNRIIHRQVLFQSLLRAQMITKTVEPPEPIERRKLFAGLNINYSGIDGRILPGFGLNYEGKNHSLYGYTYNPYLQQHCVSFMYLIHFK